MFAPGDSISFLVVGFGESLIKIVGNQTRMVEMGKEQRCNSVETCDMLYKLFGQIPFSLTHLSVFSAAATVAQKTVPMFGHFVMFRL